LKNGGGKTQLIILGADEGQYFTLWPKVERPPVFSNHVARNQEFGLSTVHTKAKGCRNLK
jgi:hypothetical protein